LKVCSEGGKLFCHSIEGDVKWELIIKRLEVIASHIAKIKIRTLIKERVAPKEEIVFQHEK